MFASITVRHLNLKHNIIVLTNLLLFFFYNKALLEWQIPLEILSKAEIATR